jgi:hypothetical protein
MSVTQAWAFYLAYSANPPNQSIKLNQGEHP